MHSTSQKSAGKQRLSRKEGQSISVVRTSKSFSSCLVGSRKGPTPNQKGRLPSRKAELHTQTPPAPQPTPRKKIPGGFSLLHHFLMPQATDFQPPRGNEPPTRGFKRQETPPPPHLQTPATELHRVSLHPSFNKGGARKQEQQTGQLGGGGGGEIETLSLAPIAFGNRPVFQSASEVLRAVDLSTGELNNDSSSQGDPIPKQPFSRD